jgi:hypothetical protein
MLPLVPQIWRASRAARRIEHEAANGRKESSYPAAVARHGRYSKPGGRDDHHGAGDLASSISEGSETKSCSQVGRVFNPLASGLPLNAHSQVRHHWPVMVSRATPREPVDDTFSNR